MTELYYCHHCEHSYEADEWERQEGKPSAEQCPKCKSLDTTTDPDLMPQDDTKTLEQENPR
jgi:NAD-dependent SIR2 family protein deacetylase